MIPVSTIVRLMKVAYEKNDYENLEKYETQLCTNYSDVKGITKRSHNYVHLFELLDEYINELSAKDQKIIRPPVPPKPIISNSYSKDSFGSLRSTVGQKRKFPNYFIDESWRSEWTDYYLNYKKTSKIPVPPAEPTFKNHRSPLNKSKYSEHITELHDYVLRNHSVGVDGYVEAYDIDRKLKINDDISMIIGKYPKHKYISYVNAINMIKAQYKPEKLQLSDDVILFWNNELEHINNKYRQEYEPCEKDYEYAFYKYVHTFDLMEYEDFVKQSRYLIGEHLYKYNKNNDMFFDDEESVREHFIKAVSNCENEGYHLNITSEGDGLYVTNVNENVDDALPRICKNIHSDFDKEYSYATNSYQYFVDNGYVMSLDVLRKVFEVTTHMATVKYIVKDYLDDHEMENSVIKNVLKMSIECDREDICLMIINLL